MFARDTYLVVTQAYPTSQLVVLAALAPPERKHVPQRPDLQLVEVFIHGVLDERLELQHPLLDLQLRLRVHAVPVLVSFHGAVLLLCAVLEAENRWVERRELRVEDLCAAVEDFVDGVYYIVDERLARRG